MVSTSEPGDALPEETLTLTPELAAIIGPDVVGRIIVVAEQDDDTVHLVCSSPKGVMEINDKCCCHELAAWIE